MKMDCEYELYDVSECNAHDIEYAKEIEYKEILNQDADILLTVLAIQKIFEESEESLKEVLESIKIYYTRNGFITEDNNGITFQNGLTLKYTKPKQISEKDYLDTIKKAENNLAKAVEQYENFKKHGCVDIASKPQLRFGTTNKAFKENLGIKKAELLKQVPVLNEIKHFTKQIAE